MIHPVIDGCIQLRNQHNLKADAVSSVALRVHPLVLELTGKTQPIMGLEGKFSVFHSAAVAIIDGAAEEAQFSDARVLDSGVVTLRDRVRASVDPSMKEDAAHIRITLTDGHVLEKQVDHAIGSLARPMSDADLEAKFRALCAPILAMDQIEALIEQCWRLDALKESGALARMTVPRSDETQPTPRRGSLATERG